MLHAQPSPRRMYLVGLKRCLKKLPDGSLIVFAKRVTERNKRSEWDQHTERDRLPGEQRSEQRAAKQYTKEYQNRQRHAKSPAQKRPVGIPYERADKDRRK